jgi:Ca2+-binding EF-hand superfamily protein
MNARIALSIALMAMAPAAFAQNAAPAASARPAQAARPAQQAGLGADAAFAAWDKDKNGSLSKDEFRAGYDAAIESLAVQRLRVEFQRHDANHDNRLDAGEYANLALVQHAGKSAPMLSAFDKDKNQSLDFAEYVEFVRVVAKSQMAAPAPKQGN